MSNDYSHLFGGPPGAAQPMPQQQQPQMPGPMPPVAPQPQGFGQQPMPQQQGFGQQPQQQGFGGGAPVSADWAQQVAGATVGNRGGQYFEPGLYVCAIEAIKVFRRQDGSNETGFVVEFKVQESDNPAVPVGDTRSFFKSIPGRNNMGAADVKDFLQKLVAARFEREGKAFDSNAPFDPQIVMFAAADAQPFKGEVLAVKAWQKPLKSDATRMFTHHDFRVLAPGTVLGLAPQGQPAAAPPAAAPPQQPAAAPAQQAPAQPGQVQWPAQPPPNWPPNAGWPPQG